MKFTGGYNLKEHLIIAQLQARGCFTHSRGELSHF
jgi:hypothetical protein